MGTDKLTNIKKRVYNLKKIENKTLTNNTKILSKLKTEYNLDKYKNKLRKDLTKDKESMKKYGYKVTKIMETPQSSQVISDKKPSKKDILELLKGVHKNG
tara:strand:- start:45183 stop:45482 length:300 start_codon:yes stop_codon:yes gene_type:complete